MESKPKLLPHIYQKIGIGVLALGIALFIGGMIFHLDVLRYFGWLISLFSALTAAFSHETIEDEFINDCRLRAIVKVAVFYIILSTIHVVMHYTIICTNLAVRQSFDWIYAISTNSTILILIYLIIFKLSIRGK